MSTLDDTDPKSRERLFPWAKVPGPAGRHTYTLGGMDVNACVWHERHSVRWEVSSFAGDRTLISGSVSLNEDKTEVYERANASDKAKRCAELWISGYRRRQAESQPAWGRPAEVSWRHAEHGFLAEVAEEEDEGWNTWRVARELAPGSVRTVDLGSGRQSTHKRAQAAALAFIEGYRAAEREAERTDAAGPGEHTMIPATDLRPGDVVCDCYDDPREVQCHMLVIASDHDGAAVYLSTGRQTTINLDAMCRLIRRGAQESD